MPKRAPPGWRAAFLRALGRSGNVRAAAAAAGVDPGTVYDHRHKDVKFAARFEKARAKAKARGEAQHPLRRRSGHGEELVERRSKAHGVQLVRTAAGRWSARAEADFLAELRRSGNVKRAATAIGMSTTAPYNRRLNYPALAAKWEAALAEAGERVPALLDAAAIASLDPEIEEEEGLPPVSVDQAIAICRMRGWGKARGAGSGPGAGSALRYGPPEPSIEQVRDDVLERVAAIRRHRSDGGAE